MARIEPHAEEIIRLYEGGLSLSQVAARYDSGPSSIWNLLVRHDVKCRAQPVANKLKWQSPEYRAKQTKAIRKAVRRHYADEKADRYADLASRVRPEHGRAYHYITEMASGLCASQVAERHGTTRNTVIGVVWRFQQKHQPTTTTPSTRAE